MRLRIVDPERLRKPLAPEVIHLEARRMAGRKEDQDGNQAGNPFHIVWGWSALAAVLCFTFSGSTVGTTGTMVPSGL